MDPIVKGAEKMKVDEIALLIALEEDFLLLLESGVEDRKTEPPNAENRTDAKREKSLKIEESKAKLIYLRSLLNDKI